MRAIILCDGRQPDENTIRNKVKEADLFIAADGGGNIARRLKLVPHIVIGDLDSYQDHPEDSSEIIHEPDQETNDLEKALSLAFKKEATHVDVFGAIGKRLDHTLKNLSVLKQFNESFHSLRYLDPYGELHLLPKKFEGYLPINTTVSLFPLSGKVTGIHTTGLKYPLNQETLENGVRDGTSNKTTHEHIEITHEKGDLLLFIVTKPDTY